MNVQTGTGRGLVCPACGEGTMHDTVEKEEVSYKSHNRILDMQYSTCDVCGAELTSGSQVLNNKNGIQAFKLEIDALLDGPGLSAVKGELK